MDNYLKMIFHKTAERKIWRALVIVLLCTLIMHCEYFSDPIKKDDLHSPWPILPDSLSISSDFLTYQVDDITLVMTETDYVNACSRDPYHWYDLVPPSDDFAGIMHMLGPGGNPEDFKDEIYITIPYDINEFSFETANTDLVIYRYDLFPNYMLNLDDFEMLPSCKDDKDNHTVRVITNYLRGRYIVGRP